MTPDDLTTDDACVAEHRLEQLAAALDATLSRCARFDDGPQFAEALEVSALLVLAEQKILRGNPADRWRYLGMLEHVKQQVTPWPAGGRPN